jgi:anti-sigma B factor antagonist
MLCAPQRASSAPVLEIQGTLRVPLNSDLRSQVEAVLRRGHRRILLDVSALLEIDAAGIGELIQAYNMTSTEGGVLRIVGSNGRVRRLLEITGLFELLTHGVSPEQDALAARGLWHR